MSLAPLLRLMKKGQLLPALRASARYEPYYALCYLAGAKNAGLLERLANEPASMDELADAHCRDVEAREALEAWLQLGVRLGLLRHRGERYSLRGLALALSRPENDATLALVQEVVTLHHKLIVDTPVRLREGRPWQLEDQDGALTARSSRALEAFQIEAIDKSFPAAGPVRLLEVGCGSAFYLHYAAMKNPALQAVGVELQREVAAIARANVERWGLGDRVAIEAGDIRDKAATPTFDIVTLYNDIYYFPVAERVPLLARLKEFLAPGGFLLLTTCCQGGNLGMEVLNLWGAATASAGRLPSVGEMQAQLAAAGYAGVDTMRLIPGDAFYAFRAR
ncbi:MAG TPA: methyltransferase domain-containing protein [Gammaproteobacteria bacterium]|nr:methyltransferase domain-containing protein [Gammaproteobacteria bacterium]